MQLLLLFVANLDNLLHQAVIVALGANIIVFLRLRSNFTHTLYQLLDVNRCWVQLSLSLLLIFAHLA